jgi:hypothetical protein
MALGATAAAVTAIGPTVLIFGWIAARIGVPPGDTLLGAGISEGVPVAVVCVAAATARRLAGRDRRALQIGFLVGVVCYLIMFAGAIKEGWRDAFAYYSLHVTDPYSESYATGGVLYPPPFFQVTEPLRALSWPIFLVLVSGVELASLWIVAGPLAAALLFIPFVALEAWYANINLILAAVIALGFRWPVLWSVMLLTKITPGIGLAWFAVRREWRSLGLALGFTAAVATVSFIAAPDLWSSWVAAASEAVVPDRATGFAPLPVRIVVGLLIVAWGGLNDRPWTVPIASTIALPAMWPAALSILVAVVPLARQPTRRLPARRAVDWALRSS